MHFQAQSFHTSMYASSWFLTIFLTSFPLSVATRIFDIFMCEVSQRKTCLFYPLLICLVCITAVFISYKKSSLDSTSF